MPKKEAKPATPDIPESTDNEEESAKTSDLPEIPLDDESSNAETTEVKERVPEPKDSPVDLNLVKYLMQVFEDSSVTEFEVSQGDFQLMLSKNATATAGVIAAAPQAAPAAPAQSSGGSSQQDEDSNHFFIKSPMVGTFYRAASPDAEPFIDIGEKVQESTLVCIIEAMKVMNELPADCNGTIVDILVENGHGVEYGQPLFKVAKK